MENIQIMFENVLMVFGGEVWKEPHFDFGLWCGKGNMYFSYQTVKIRGSK